MSESETSPAQELQAMQAVAEALTPLDTEATGRVIRWATERFGKFASQRNRNDGQSTPRAPQMSAEGEIQGSTGSSPQFEHLADLHAAASPSTDADRALVAGYWFQYIVGTPDFGAQTINTALKDLGHRVSNITNAFAALMAQKPQLVVQLKKAGTSKQARKTYKLTAAGKSAVEKMISSEE